MSRYVLAATVALILSLVVLGSEVLHLRRLALDQRYLLLASPQDHGALACQRRGLCASDLAWRAQGTWQSLCPQPPPPDDPSWRPQRYYRLQWRCAAGNASYILLSWTLLR